MHEQSKSARRRYFDGAFHSRFFVGKGLDIGAGADSLGLYANEFRAITEVMAWDMPNGDAQYLETLFDNSFDFVHSSHCLEHMVNVKEALLNWIRVVKPKGHLIITVPDEDMYEQRIWPSVFNSDHKHTFTMGKETSWSPVSVNVLELLASLKSIVSTERVSRVSDFYKFDSRPTDQTLRPNPECAIEFILRKL